MLSPAKPAYLAVAPTYCVGNPARPPSRQLAEHPRQIMFADLVSSAVWFVIVISLRLRGFQVRRDL